MSDEELDDLWPLYDIAGGLGGVSPKQLGNWASRRDKTGFPMPKKQVGRYYVYSLKEVTEWYTLWRRATSRMGGSRIAVRTEASDGDWVN